MNFVMLNSMSSLDDTRTPAVTQFYRRAYRRCPKAAASMARQGGRGGPPATQRDESGRRVDDGLVTLIGG